MRKSGSSRIACLGMMALLGGVLSSTVLEKAHANLDDAQGILEEIALSEAIAEDENVGDRLRSNALDNALESRADLLGLRKSREDPRRPIWLADQAEALLLRRIELPSSWSTHLMVAHQSCPLMPSEIPLIVARGIENVLQAEEVVSDMIEGVESSAGFDEQPELISLHERLEFERDLRIPLLKAIGLLLAAGADPSSGTESLGILRMMREGSDLTETTKAVIDHWLRQAALVTGNEETLRSLATTGTPPPDLAPLERLREASVLKNRIQVVELGERLIGELDREGSYEKLLLADVVERTISQDAGDGTPRGWGNGQGRTWIMLLDEGERDGDSTLDGPLALRMVDLERRHGRNGAPLAVLWACGQQELAGRSRGEIGEPEMLGMLRRAAMDAERDEPARARALETAARIALLEDERLTAAELCETLYREHPEHPFGGPRLVADLTEPWARAGREEVARRYERALEDLITELSSREEQTDLGTQTLRLAEHHLRRGRPERSRGLLRDFRPETPAEAARLLEASLDEIDLTRRLENLTDEQIDLEYDLLQRTAERMLGEFGPFDATLEAAASRARLVSIDERSRLPSDNRSIRLVERIIALENIPVETKIDALFLRHRMKLIRSSERQEALLDMPELLEARDISPELTAGKIVETMQEGMSLLEALRRGDPKPGDEKKLIEELKTLAGLIEASSLTTLTVTQMITVGQCFTELGLVNRSIPHWTAMAERRPDAWIIMQGRADALALSTEFADLAEALRLYIRLGQDGPGDNVPKDVWWHARLGQLLMLEKANRSTEKIPTRIERLRLIDPELGGSVFGSQFESLLRRMSQKS